MQSGALEIQELNNKIINLQNILKIYPNIEVIFDNILYLPDLYKFQHEVLFLEDNADITINLVQNLNSFIIHGLPQSFPIISKCEECADKHITIEMSLFKEYLKDNIKYKQYREDIIDKSYIYILEFIKTHTPKYDARSIPSRYRKLMNFV